MKIFCNVVLRMIRAFEGESLMIVLSRDVILKDLHLDFDLLFIHIIFHSL